MQAKYFAGTDTLLLVFSDKEISDTHDLNENVIVETDKEGHVVSMTLEHAARQTNVDKFSY